jgi:starvation-inducible DNA-binding protein
MATKTSSRTFNTSVKLTESTRQQIIDILNARLADTIDLKTQAKQAHWNVKGPEFFQLHELFDSIAGHLDDQADLIAERVTALGGTALGTARVVASTSAIPEYDLDAVGGLDHVVALSERLAKAANQFRTEIDRTDDLGDKATADLFTQITRNADKDLWFLEAHLQK